MEPGSPIQGCGRVGVGAGVMERQVREKVTLHALIELDCIS